jgi:starch-binding outer membrane protein, SusD/RagB family
MIETLIFKTYIIIYYLCILLPSANTKINPNPDIMNYMQSKLCIIVLMVFLIGCQDDFLNVPHLVDETDQNFDSGMAVTACYNININTTQYEYPNIRWFNYQTFIQGDAISDDAFLGGSGDAMGMRGLELFSSNGINAQTYNFWRVQYIKIYHMNYALEGIAADRTITESLRERYISEVKFLRALNYFMLVRVYGGVPAVFKLGNDYKTTGRASEQAIYEQIEADLLEAISVLPSRAEYPVSDLGRATRDAARGLLAKVYLYQQKYQQCYDVTSAIISSGIYQLESDYADLWKRGLPNNRRNEHGVESLFEFTSAANPEGVNAADWAVAQRAHQTNFETSKGWGMINPTLDLLDEFEQGDPRVISTFMFNGDSLVDPTGKIVIAVETSFGNSFRANEHHMLNMKVHRKLTDNPASTDNSGENYIVLRYADILLMHAEAANELGYTSEALAKINIVRARARNSVRTDYRREYINFKGVVPNPNLPAEESERSFQKYDWYSVEETSILPDIAITGKDELRMAIWKERRVEFALEGERFYDLVRQSKVIPNRVGNLMRTFAQKWNTEKGKYFEDGTHERFPIPQSEIDLMGPQLIPQNPGY